MLCHYANTLWCCLWGFRDTTCVPLAFAYFTMWILGYWLISHIEANIVAMLLHGVCIYLCTYCLFNSQVLKNYSNAPAAQPQLRRGKMQPIFTTPPALIAFNAIKSNTMTPYNNFTVQKIAFLRAIDCYLLVAHKTSIIAVSIMVILLYNWWPLISHY